MSTGGASPKAGPWTYGSEAPARCIVCERTGAWAAAMRRQPEAAGLRLCETRSLAECWKSLDRASGSFAIVELTRACAEELLDRLARMARESPRARVAVVAERSLAAWEDLLREAGAVAFVVSARELGTLVAVARRHLEQVPALPQSVAQRIWADLPWAGVAAGANGSPRDS